MARKKINSATDQRKFTLVYNDFLESTLLNYYEKMVFIVLKKFADNDTMTAFPSYNTIQKLTGISISTIRRSIEHMQELGVISVNHRNDDKKGHQSNLYTLYDFAEIWDIDSNKKNNCISIVDEVTEAKMIAALKAKGYIVTKEKEPESTEPTKVTGESSTQLNQYDIVNTTLNLEESQEAEKYSLEEIRVFYDYQYMIDSRPYEKDDIDSVINILHTSLNTTKKTIRIHGEDKPSAVVVGRLMKLSYAEILYVIDKYKEQSNRIKNPSAYILTLLYNSKEQMNLDIVNQVQYDMNNQGK